MFISDGHHSDFKGWTRKHPDSWTRSDVLDWVFYCAEKISAEIGEDCSSLRAEKFSNLTGEALCRMGPEDFRLLEPMFGLSLYESFRKLLHEGGWYLVEFFVTVPMCLNPLLHRY